METHRVHRLMFYNLEPKSIVNIAYNKVDNLVAVLRSDNRVEIWNVQALPHIQSTILLKPLSKLKAIAWSNKQLFGADLDGFIKEFDLVSLREKKSYPVTSGGPCHCLAINKANTLMAVGTELGYINIFEINKNGLSFVKFIQSDKRRILTICWDVNSDYVITGSLKWLKMFNYCDGRLIHVMKPIQRNKRRYLIVWSVVVTDDFTIIAGDSEGFLSIWDGKKGICTESIKSHSSEILTVCLSEDQKSVYCAGIDPVIKIYKKMVMMDNTIKWVKFKDIVSHSHDVHGLIQINNEWLCSGGVDSYLSLSKTLPFTVQLYPPLLQNPSVSVAIKARCILLRYATHLELWHLKDVSPDLLCLEPFIKLIELRPINNELIRCAAISKDGSLIFYATNTSARVFRFTFNEVEPKLLPLSVAGCTIENVHNVTFSSDSQRLIISDSSSLIQVFSTTPAKSSELSLLYDISLCDNQEWSDSPISLLATSHNGDFVAAASCDRKIGVWKKNKFHGSLPKYRLPATTVAFHPHKNFIYAIYSDFKFIEFSVDKLHYTNFSRSFNSSLLERYLSKRNLPVINISFDYDIEDIIILHTSSTICVFDKSKVASRNHNIKKMKLDPNAKKSPCELLNKQDGKREYFTLTSYFKDRNYSVLENDLAADKGFRVYEKYQHLVHFENFGSREMIAVEIKPCQFLEKLPPLLKKKKYGRK